MEFARSVPRLKLALLVILGFSLSVMGQVVLDVSLDDQDMTILPPSAGARLGAPNTLALGDFNADGFQDLLLGAPNADRPGITRAETGVAYIIYGRPDLPAELDLGGTPGADVMIVGIGGQDHLGTAVAAGDINGDGIDDILLGAPGGDGELDSVADVGEVYVIFGSQNLPEEIALAQTPADMVIYGSLSRSGFGQVLSALDLNGDRVDDIVIADPLGEGPGSSRPDAGNLYIFFGRPNLPSKVALGSTPADLTVYGEDAGDQLGTALAEGDLNGDGLEDLLIGAPQADGPADRRPNAGEVYVIAGDAQFPSVIDLAAKSGTMELIGADAQDRLGSAIGAGDVDGDGFDDLIVGAPFGAGPENGRGFSGEAYLVFGRSDLLAVVDLAEAPQGVVTVYGEDQLDNLGTAVTSGDVDGDGVTDVILGASNARGAGNAKAGAGDVYVLRGRASLPATLDLAQGVADFVIHGAETLDAFGSALATGNANGKGNSNLLIGAVGADAPGGRTDSGIVYVFFVLTPPPPPIADAGPDQFVPLTATVQLDGSGSRDPEGRSLTFQWHFVCKPEGSEATLSDPTAVNPTFVADKVGDYVLELLVTNDRGDTATDRVTITAMIKGDVNFDGQVDLVDAQWVAEYLVGLREFTEAQKYAADVRPDCQVIDVKDVRWIAEFPFKGAQEPMCLEPVAKSAKGPGICAP